MSHEVPIATVLNSYRPGSGDWTWACEFAEIGCRDDLTELVNDIKANGIREPILLGNDGRVWDGHHRVMVAVALDIKFVPVTWPAAVGGSCDTPRKDSNK